MALTQDLESIRLLSISREPNTLERISHKTKTRPRKFTRTGYMAAHIEERNRKKRAVFLETSDHALLTLCDKHKTLGADFRNSGYAATGNIFASDGFETA